MYEMFCCLENLMMCPFKVWFWWSSALMCLLCWTSSLGILGLKKTVKVPSTNTTTSGPSS